MKTNVIEYKYIIERLVTLFNINYVERLDEIIENEFFYAPRVFIEATKNTHNEFVIDERRIQIHERLFPAIRKIYEDRGFYVSIKYYPCVSKCGGRDKEVVGLCISLLPEP